MTTHRGLYFFYQCFATVKNGRIVIRNINVSKSQGVSTLLLFIDKLWEENDSEYLKVIISKYDLLLSYPKPLGNNNSLYLLHSVP